MAWDRYFCHIHSFWLTDIRTPLLKHLYPLAFSNMNKYSSGHLAIAETGKTPSHISGFARSSTGKAAYKSELQKRSGKIPAPLSILHSARVAVTWKTTLLQNV
jgi:hypothetical protein